MAYREVEWMETSEVVRRWRAGESQRQIARALGLARNTVAATVRAAQAAETCPGDGAAPVVLPARLPGPRPVAQPPQLARLAPYEAQIATWLQREHLRLTRVQELLSHDGLRVPYTTLRRFVRQAGLGRPGRTTVRMADTAPGEVAEMDFGRLGLLVDAHTRHRQMVDALVVVLASSRYSVVWPLLHQTLEAVIAGLEHVWRVLGGVPRRLVVDNFPAAVAGPDRYQPRLTRGFLEYSQARGFLVDPARVARPQDKPKVERHIHYVQERFWKGGTFTDLADVRQQADHWGREVAGLRVHGTTRRVPRVVFEEEERSQLLPYDGVPYDVPTWREVTVHPDHHTSVLYALYSAPSVTCPPGTKLEARADRDLVRLYRRGALQKTHPRQPKGGRSTDPADYPQEKTAYALRAPDRLVDQAEALGPSIGRFATALLAGPLPWAKLRQGQKLLRLAERYTPARLDAACERALAFDLVNVARLERIVVLALEHEGSPAPPLDERVLVLPVPRYARTGAAFDHRYPLSAAPDPEERP